MSISKETTCCAKRNGAIVNENPCDHLFVLLTDDPECIKCGIPYAEGEFFHEDDGNCYLTQPSQIKCRKCGELYR